MKRPTLISLAVFLTALGALLVTPAAPALGTDPGIAVMEDPILPPGMPLPPRPVVSESFSVLGDPILPPGMPLPPRPSNELA